jgi:small subunit ribosomal protein S11e
VDVSFPVSLSPQKCTAQSSFGIQALGMRLTFSRDYLHFVKKYNRYEKRHKNLAAHVSPCFRVKEGDYVTVGQCRPLSKTVRFNLLKINRSDEGSKQFGKF